MRSPIARCCFVLLLPILGGARAGAQDHEHQAHAAHDIEGLGAVHFPVSCLPDVQPAFDRAVALLHSFNYEAARLGFRDVAQRDPACAMARWGEAMTYYHPIWAP